MKRSTSVTVAAAFLLAGGLFITFGAVLAVLGQLLIRTVPIQTPHRGQETLGPLLFALGMESLLALWAIVTAIGLFRLRNWARISILVLSGFVAISTAFALVALIAVLPVVMNTQVRELPPGMSTFLPVMVVSVTVVPFGCAIWWLILFLRKSVRLQFQATRLERASASVASGVVVSQSPIATAPAMFTPPAAEIPRPPKIPTSILVIAIYLLAMSPLALLGLPYAARLRMPNILLGILLTGWRAWASLATMMALQFALGILLVLKKAWAIDGTITYAVFVLLNSLLYAFSPARDAMIAAAFRNLPLPPEVPAEFFHQFMYVMLTFSIIFSVLKALVALYFLFTRRPAYLSACTLRAERS
jgi:hypothetical protein